MSAKQPDNGATVAAGGWGSLKAVTRYLMREEVPPPAPRRWRCRTSPRASCA